MTRYLHFTIYDSEGRDVGGWTRPRGATPAHRRDHLARDKLEVWWHRKHGRTITLQRN